MSRSSSGPALFFGLVHDGAFSLVSRDAFETIHAVLR